jgi:hypothetical protein
MRVLFGALQRGLKMLWSRPERPVPCEVACNCGWVYRGLRRGRSHVARCGACGGFLFVFPRSPLPPVADEPPAGLEEAAATRRRSPWLLPVVAACLTLAVVVGGYVFLFSSLLHPSGHADADSSRKGGPHAAEKSLSKSLEDGRQELAARNFHQAFEVLNEACNRHPHDKELRQLLRQAELLKELVDKPLEVILHDGQMVGNAEEWKARFRKYEGHSVVFDDVIGRAPNGEYQLQNYEVTAGDERVVVKLDLALFDSLPLERPRRLLFGARLASVAREGGVWVVRFERDSGVLLTEEGAVTACGLAPLDAELRELLRQQEQWVKGQR